MLPLFPINFTIPFISNSPQILVVTSNTLFMLVMESLLIDISNELLHYICTFVDCEDLKTFNLTCRRAHLVALPLLVTHRAQWSKFEALSDDFRTVQWFWYKLPVGLLTTSRGAPYIRHITYGRCFHGPAPFHSPASLRDWDIILESEKTIPPETPKTLPLRRRAAPKRMSDEHLETLIVAARSIEWIKENEAHSLRTKLRSLEQPYILALLLPLLPNLRTLTIEASSSNPQSYL